MERNKLHLLARQKWWSGQQKTSNDTFQLPHNWSTIYSIGALSSMEMKKTSCICWGHILGSSGELQSSKWGWRVVPDGCHDQMTLFNVDPASSVLISQAFLQSSRFEYHKLSSHWRLGTSDTSTFLSFLSVCIKKFLSKANHCIKTLEYFSPSRFYFCNFMKIYFQILKVYFFYLETKFLWADTVTLPIIALISPLFATHHNPPQNS